MFDVIIRIPDLDQPTPEAAAEAARLFLGGEIMLHDLQFEATGRDRITHHVELKGHEIELPRMLVLSTEHMTAETARRMWAQPSTVPNHYAKGSYGWLIPLSPDDPYQRWDQHADLVAIRQLAESVGATWIMLDRDAKAVAALPTYEW